MKKRRIARSSLLQWSTKRFPRSSTPSNNFIRVYLFNGEGKEEKTMWKNERTIGTFVERKKKKKNKGRKKINSAFVYKFMCVYLHSLHLYTARLSLSVLLDMIHIHIMESFFFIYEKTRSRLTFCPKMYNAHYC